MAVVLNQSSIEPRGSMSQSRDFGGGLLNGSFCPLNTYAYILKKSYIFSITIVSMKARGNVRAP